MGWAENSNYNTQGSFINYFEGSLLSMKHVCCVLLHDMWVSPKDQTAFVSKNPPLYLLLPNLSICSHILSYQAPRLPMFGDCFLPQTEKILEVSGITKCWSNIKALLMYRRTSHMFLDHSYPDSLHSFILWSCIGNWSLPVLLPCPPFCEFITSIPLMSWWDSQRCSHWTLFSCWMIFA